MPENNVLPFPRRSPQPELRDRVRFMREFIQTVEELETLRRLHDELFQLYIKKLQEVIAPYALDLALSLIAADDVNPEAEHA